MFNPKSLPRFVFLSITLCFCSLTGPASAKTSAPLFQLKFETSRGEETGRYDEVMRLCDQLRQSHRKQLRCESFGTTPEDRPLLAFILGDRSIQNARQAKAKNKTVVLTQGGIHAGEIDGKDAGFLVLREWLNGQRPNNADRLIWIFVPVFNVDGHERFKAWNRPNQRGPKEMGWRTTAQNYNLNRDYVKADSPEMRAMHGLIQRWDPVLTLDMHVTDGAQFEHDVSVQIEPHYAGDSKLQTVGKAIQTQLLDELSKLGHLPLPFYPSFVEYDNPESGFVDGVAPPRFSTGYFHLRNRFGILLETHSWRPYAHRVNTTANTLRALLRAAAEDGAHWVKETQAADARANALVGQAIAIEYAAKPEARIIEFRGYAYTRTPSEVSGGLMTRYDESKPALWKIPLRDQVEPSKFAQLPRAGYWIPSSVASLVEPYLRTHGLDYFDVIKPSHQTKEARVFRANTVALGTSSVEGHQRAAIEGQWQSEPMPLTARGLFVPSAQAKAQLVLHLLEPTAPDSLAAWGLFNGFWEQKEYLEAYVAEAIARDMLQDPGVQRAFDAWLNADPKRKDDAGARLEFFHRRHSSWDANFMRYPIFALDNDPR